jgi:UDP:flavonoid glycosyltransferase YjiC (YdhE family)
VAVPITYEQPAIARRTEWTGAGRAIALSRLAAGRLREAARSVLDEPAYRAAAQRLGYAIYESGGTRRAADIVETAMA